MLLYPVSGWIPLAFDLAALTAVGAIVCGALGIRRSRDLQSIGLALAAWAIALVTLSIYAFAWLFFWGGTGD